MLRKHMSKNHMVTLRWHHHHHHHFTTITTIITNDKQMTKWNSWPCAQWNSQGVVFDFQTSQQKGPGPCPDRTIIVIIKLKHGGTTDSTFVGLQPNILTNATVCQNKSNTTIESRLPTPTWQNNSVENEMLFDHDWKKKQLALCTSSISTKKHIQTNQHKTRMNETHPINFESIPQISVLDWIHVSCHYVYVWNIESRIDLTHMFRDLLMKHNVQWIWIKFKQSSCARHN